MTTRNKASIRRARLEDYPDARRLMDGLDEFHRDRLPWMFKAPASQPRPESFFADLLDQKDAVVFVADAGHLVGIAIGLLRAAPDFPVFVQQRWGVLDNLVVEPAWRRRGIGKLLAQSIEQWAWGSGAPWVELSVYEFNAGARKFYESLGYLPLTTKMRKAGPDTAQLITEPD